MAGQAKMFISLEYTCGHREIQVHFDWKYSTVFVRWVNIIPITVTLTSVMVVSTACGSLNRHTA
jgi:hypothetical protein